MYLLLPTIFFSISNTLLGVNCYLAGSAWGSVGAMIFNYWILKEYLERLDKKEDENV